MTAVADRSIRSRIAACALVALAFVLPAVAVIAAGLQRTATYADQAEYHLPTIEQFAREWPAFNFATATAAMTPGYHLLMAALLKLGACTTALQLASAAITAGFLATLAWVVSARLSVLDTVLLCLPIAWSQYVFVAGVYVAPHNLAWWGVLLIVTVATGASWSARSAVLAGLVLAATVFVRQIHLWTAAGLVTAAAFADGVGFDRLGRRARRVGIALACCLPAIAVLGYFYWLWGGLAPRTQTWARPADGINFAAIAMLFATFGFVAPLLIARLPAGRRQWLATIAGGAVGLVVAVVGPTTFDADAGRWSGLWNLAGAVGVVAERSVLITVLSAAGAACVGLLLASADPRRGWTWAALLAGFVAANAKVFQAWQRYYEPMVLMACVLLLCGERPSKLQRWGRFGIAMVQAGLTVLAFRA